MHHDEVDVPEDLHFWHVHDKPQSADLVTIVARHPNAVAFPSQLKQLVIPKTPCSQRRRPLLAPSCLYSPLSTDSRRDP